MSRRHRRAGPAAGHRRGRGRPRRRTQPGRPGTAIRILTGAHAAARGGRGRAGRGHRRGARWWRRSRPSVGIRVAVASGAHVRPAGSDLRGGRPCSWPRALASGRPPSALLAAAGHGGGAGRTGDRASPSWAPATSWCRRACRWARPRSRTATRPRSRPRPRGGRRGRPPGHRARRPCGDPGSAPRRGRARGRRGRERRRVGGRP